MTSIVTRKVTAAKWATGLLVGLTATAWLVFMPVWLFTLDRFVLAALRGVPFNSGEEVGIHWGFAPIVLWFLGVPAAVVCAYYRKAYVPTILLVAFASLVWCFGVAGGAILSAPLDMFLGLGLAGTIVSTVLIVVNWNNPQPETK